jgi:hypothetical protein
MPSIETEMLHAAVVAGAVRFPVKPQTAGLVPTKFKAGSEAGTKLHGAPNDKPQDDITPISEPASSFMTNLQTPFWLAVKAAMVVIVGVIVVPHADAVKVPSGLNDPV